MRSYTAVIADVTPGQLDHLKAEYKTSPTTFREKAALHARLSDEDLGVIEAEFLAEAKARGEA